MIVLKNWNHKSDDETTSEKSNYEKKDNKNELPLFEINGHYIIYILKIWLLFVCVKVNNKYCSTPLFVKTQNINIILIL